MMVELAVLYHREKRVNEARAELARYLDYRDATPGVIPNAGLDIRHET